MTTAEASFSGSRLLARGAIGPGQATPKAWVTQTVPNAKTAPINGLTALRSPTIRANGSNIAAFASYLGETFAGPLSKRHILRFSGYSASEKILTSDRIVCLYICAFRLFAQAL